MGERLGGQSQAQTERRAWDYYPSDPRPRFEAMEVFDTQDARFPPKVHGSDRVWGKKALTVSILKQFLTVCSCGEVGALSVWTLQ